MKKNLKLLIACFLLLGLGNYNLVDTHANDAVYTTADSEVLDYLETQTATKVVEDVIKVSEDEQFEYRVEIYKNNARSTDYFAKTYFKNKMFLIYNQQGTHVIELYENNQLKSHIVSTFSDYDRETVMSDMGWGYSFEANSDERSYSCPRGVADALDMSRVNIEIYDDEAVSAQEDFSGNVFRLMRAEDKLLDAVSDAAYMRITDILGDLIGASFGDYLDALTGFNTMIEAGEITTDALDAGDDMLNYSADLYDDFERMLRYDHLS